MSGVCCVSCNVDTSADANNHATVTLIFFFSWHAKIGTPAIHGQDCIEMCLLCYKNKHFFFLKQGGEDTYFERYLAFSHWKTSVL